MSKNAGGPRKSDDKKNMRNRRWSRDRVKIPRAIASKKHPTCHEILNRKAKRIKFNSEEILRELARYYGPNKWMGIRMTVNTNRDKMIHTCITKIHTKTRTRNYQEESSAPYPYSQAHNQNPEEALSIKGSKEEHRFPLNNKPNKPSVTRDRYHAGQDPTHIPYTGLDTIDLLLKLINQLGNIGVHGPTPLPLNVTGGSINHVATNTMPMAYQAGPHISPPGFSISQAQPYYYYFTPGPSVFASQ
ncbi:hypothetical protein Tco_0954020 [Tanacetum coccineum]|uniref:Uncharacterized protein n=1 Tax=Tanacetum coccineum TaxID=301880 RepID=A0ABQ5E1J0_9ASTR